MNNLLITGGAGFIGSHFVLRHVALHPNDRIVVLDKLTYAADIHFLDTVKNQIVFIEGDIADFPLVDSILEKHSIDTIINFAAETHVDNSIADSSPFIHTNIIGVQNLIDICRKYPNVKLLHISTDEVYGDISDDDAPRQVSDPLWPSSPYAASKASSEMLLIAAMRTYKIPCAITRCTNNYGPHQADEKFMPTVIRNAVNNQPIPIYAEGKNKRDWLYVSDHCDGIEKVLETDWAFEEQHFFNISADNEQRNIDVAKKILSILRKPESLISFAKDRPGHDWRYALNSSGIRKLGWKPSTSFDDGLKKTIEWYKSKYK